MCFCGLIWLNELQIAIRLGGIEESRGQEQNTGILILSFLGGLVGRRRAGAHA